MCNEIQIIHHPVFYKFQCWDGEIKENCYYDFLGTYAKNSYFEFMPSSELNYPIFNEEYFEWVDLLESVINADYCFTMIELGAGWGRWLCRGAAAVKQYNDKLIYNLIGVEAEPIHYQNMIEHFINNNINLKMCKLFNMAVSKKSGSCRFYFGDSFANYGQRIATRKEKDNRIHKQKSISLNDILLKLSIVDLIDIDIQGSELEVLKSVNKKYLHKVKRIHIGTHSSEVEKGLRKLFNSLGWHNRFDYSQGKINSTDYGDIEFQDGVQSWLNPMMIE